MSDSSSTSQVIGEIDADAVPNDPNSESHSPDHHNSQRYPPTAAVDTTYELEEGEESNYSDDDNVQTRSPPVNGEADYHGEIIDLEDNNELNYEEEEGIANEDDAGVENGSADDLMIMDVEMRVTSISDSEEDASNLALSKELNDCSPLINEDHDQSPKHDSKAQSVSDQSERESQNTGEAEGSEEGELNDDEDNKVEEVLEEEETEKNLNLDLEDGEIVDSDDGIPEIEGGLSPPTIQKSEEPSAYVSKKSSDFFSLSRYQPQPLMEKEREVCRFFLRGSCRNGEACRFKHSRDARSRLQITSASSLPASRVSTYYSRILIPPPIGPPVPLLSTEFAPPPIMVAALRPPAPVNAESTAWEQGLKKARELVRRQKGESIEEKNVEMENETLHKKQIDESGAASPTLASISPDPYSYLTVEPFERQSSTHQQFSMHSIAQTRRPLTSRVVVEAISVVTGSPREESSTRLASRIVRPSVNKQRIIPSLIDTIIEQPNLDDLPKTRRRDERSQLSRPTLMNTRYADPWARNAGTDRGREDKMRRVDDRHRKRRRSSSSNSSSGKEEKRSRAHHHRQPHSPQRQKEEQHEGRQHDSRRYANYPEKQDGPESERTRKSRRNPEERHRITKPIEMSGDEGNVVNRVSITKSGSSSNNEKIIPQPQKDVVINTATNNHKTKRKRSSSSSSSSSSSTHAKRSAATLGSLLTSKDKRNQNRKDKGPKTPPEEERLISSRSSSTSSASTWSGGHKRGSSSHAIPNCSSKDSANKSSQLKRRNSIMDRGSGHKNMPTVMDHGTFLGEDNEEDDAPAAYRMQPRKSGERNEEEREHRKLTISGRKTRSSSLSSSTSSSTVSSSNTSISSVEKRKNAKKTQSIEAKIDASHGEKSIKEATICSSQRLPQTPPPHLGENFERIIDERSQPGKERGDGIQEKTNSFLLKSKVDEESPTLTRGNSGSSSPNLMVIPQEMNSRNIDRTRAIIEGEPSGTAASKKNDKTEGKNIPADSTKSTAANKQLNQKRREELRRKLKSVEEEIAKKRRQSTSAATEHSA